MKKIKKIIFWSIVSISIQMAGLLFLNNYYLTADSKVTIKKIEEDIIKVDSKKVEVYIPENAKNIKTSYNGDYTSYFIDGTLNVVRNDTGDIEKVTAGKGNAFLYYKWLPDRDRIFILETVKDEDSTDLRLFSYDLDKKEKIAFKVENMSILDGKYEVSDIQMSVRTNDKYIKLTNANKKSIIYWINVEEQAKKVSTRTSSIGSMFMLQHDNKMFYEDLNYNKIYSVNTNDNLNIKAVTSPQILSVDSEDNIYIGQAENGKIRSIYYGQSDVPTNKWNVIQISESVEKKDILISESGKIYTNDSAKGTITELITKKSINYSGKLIQIYEGGIASIDNGKLILTQIVNSD